MGRDPSKFGKNKDIDLTSLTVEDFPIHAEVDYSSVARIRDQAAACHASQGGRNMTSGLQGLVFRFLRRTETYMQAYPAPQAGAAKTADLFAGVELNPDPRSVASLP